MKRITLFIGKFNPFHEGHKLILDTLLQEGDEVEIGIKREINTTELNNFKKELKGIYGFNIKIIQLPNFNRIAHGRTTGYTFERISTPKEMNKVSSSKIREVLK